MRFNAYTTARSTGEDVMSQQKQRHRVAPRYKKAKDRSAKDEGRQATQHRVAWVAASPSLGYASVAGDADPRELEALRRTCSECEHEGYRLVSVSAFVGVIDPGLGGIGTLGWYLFFVRTVDGNDAELSLTDGSVTTGPPDYLRRRAHVSRE